MIESHRLRLSWGGTTAELSTDRRELCAALAGIYGPFVRAAQPSPIAAGRPLAPSASGGGAAGGWRASLDGQRYHFAAFSDAVCELSYDISQRLLAAPLGCVLLHAAAVVKDARMIFVVGPSGSGKTTLALELVRRGFRYLTDEFAAVDLSGRMLHPFPRSATLKQGRRQQRGKLPPGDGFRLQTDGEGLQMYLPREHASLLPVPIEAPRLLFARHRAGGRHAARPLPSAPAAAELIPAAFDFGRRQAACWRVISGLAVRSTACMLQYAEARQHLDIALRLLR